MKVVIIDGVVHGQAETVKDVRQIMFISGEGQEREKKVHKPHKKHNFSKTCDDCGRQFKGLQGLEIHKSFAHKNRKPLGWEVSGTNLNHVVTHV